MKHILCHLAQKNPKPSGLIAKHVSSCPECRVYFEKVLDLETRLATPAGDADFDFCAEIMAGISSGEPVNVVCRPRRWGSSPWILPAAAAITIAMIGLFAVFNLKEPVGVASAPDKPEVGSEPPAPTPVREMNLTYALQQQELLQRDVLKLGTHLRENLILFQVADK